MHVLVATDGTIEIDVAAKFAKALAGENGRSTVATVVPVPRQLVTQLRERWGEGAPVSVDADEEYVGAPGAPGEISRGWPGDDAMVEQYLGNKRVEHCKPIVLAIRELGGNSESTVIEGSDIANGIMELARSVEADVIVIGSHGHGGFTGLLGSTGAKLVRRASRPVLVIR